MKRALFFICMCALPAFIFIDAIQADPFAFVVISDPRTQDHLLGFEQDLLQIKDWLDNPTPEMPAPAFMVNNGDYDHTRQTEAVIDSVLGSDYVWFPIIGNHEIDALYDFYCVRDTLVPVLPWIVDSGPTGSVNTTFSWDYGNAHFVSVNCYWDGSPAAGHDYVTNGNVPEELRDWIETDLTTNGLDHNFVFVHEPAYPEVRHIGDSLDEYPADRDSLVVMLDRSQTEALFVGHDHYYHHDVSSEHPLLGDVHQVDSGQVQGPGSGGDGSTIIYVKVDGDTATYKAYRSTTGMPFSLHEEWFIVSNGSYTLDVNVLGDGSVALDPPGGIYSESTAVELTASADSGWTFNGWSGDLTGDANPDTIFMTNHMSITATFVGSTAVCEDFESGFALGQELRTHADWFYEDGNSGPVPTAGIGVDGSIGLSNGNRAFAWVAHEFSWNDPLLLGVWFQMDYQTDSAGVFDDDRLGWSISDTSDNSDWIFGVQMDPGGGGAGGNIETYWDGDTFGDDGGRYSIADLPALSGNTWYRLRGEFTKLTATSAQIDVTLWELDASGDTVGQVVSGSVASTDSLPDTADEEIPNSGYFTAAKMWPVYKNFTAVDGAVDNPCFGIVATEQEQYTLSMTIVGNANVTLAPPGGSYDAGTVVTLTAVPESGWVFTGWSEDLTGNANPDSITMDSDKDVTATFTLEPSGAVICEDFESGFTLGQTVGNDGEWFDNGSGPVVNSGLGVDGSIGLAPGTAIFIWTEHQFDWTDPDFQGYHVQMDFQTDASGHLDDDRIGWMITDDDVGSSNIFGIQCDPGGSGYNIEGYWDGVSSDDRRPSIVNLPTLSNNAWYQFRADITKLTATSASIDVALIELDANGDSAGVAASGSIANTATLGDDEPNAKYFTTAIWPAYKNYTAAGANADNACFQVLSTPQTYTLIVNTVGNGSVDLDPPGVVFDSGAEVELTANADPGWTFGGWSGDLSGCANPDTVTMSDNMTVTATFIQTVTGIYTENFESGFTLGADVGEHADWFDGTDDTGSDVTAGIGLLGSIGLAPGSTIFTWTAHPFSWNAPDFQQVNLQMDFQTDASGLFNDDRLCWNIDADDYASANVFGVQLDHADSGIVTYWRDSTGTRIQDQIVDISGLSTDTWYRFRAEIGKLASTQAQIDVSLVELDGSGNPTGTPFTGTVTNTSTWPGGVPDLRYFTACTMWPAYKNFQAVDGAADNAYAEILYGPLVYDTLTVNTVGNGSVDLNPPGNIYVTGTDVVLTAVPDSGSVFSAWSEDLTGSANPDTITMSGNMSVTATFVEGPQCTLTVSTVGNGSVTLNPAGGIYDYDTEVELTAVPDSGWVFSAWSGDLTGGANPDTIAMGGSQSVTATFVEEPDLKAGDVIISSIQAWNAVGSQDPAEFVELFNTTGQTISLENMELISRTDNNTDGVLDIDWQLSASLTGQSIAPYSFFLIAESGVVAEGGVRDVQTDMDLATGEGGAAERAISLELAIDTVHMDYVVYGRDDGQNPAGEMPPGDIAFDSTASWPRSEVCRNTLGTNSFQEGLLRRESADDLYAGYALNGYYTDEGSLGDGYPNGVWYCPHDNTDDNYVARSSASDPVPPTGMYTLTIIKVGDGDVTLVPPGGSYAESTAVELTADADLGWAFDSWSGDLTGSANPDTILMDGHKTVTVTFISTNDAPDAPTLISPLDDAIDVSLNPELRVNVTDADSDTMDVTFYGRAVSGGGNFALIPIPDTQKYCLSYPWIYYDQMQWIVDSMAVWNIVFAAHEGDIVDTYGSTLEWLRADTAMSILEDPAGTGLSQGLPYSVCPGNHDTPTTNYNTYFGISRFSGRSYYGGHDGSTNDNNYCFFSAGGMDFIVISLQYNPGSGPIAWADSLLSAHSNRRGIVVTHYLLNTNGSWGGSGQTIYDTLKDNPNLFLMLCGHMHGEALRTEVFNGDTVHVVLADYQDITNGGNGWLRIMEFQPTNNRIRVLTYSPYLDQYGTGTVMGDDTISEEFFLGYNMSERDAFSSLGTVNDVVSGSDAFIDWPNRASGVEYEWYAEAFDGIATTASSIWSFTTIDTFPKCTLDVNTVGDGDVILSPSGGIYNCGSDVVLTADPDPGWQFDRWFGDLTGSANPDTLTLSGNMTVTAFFEEIPWIGWTEKFPDSHPTARAYTAMACLDGGQAALFGGWDGFGILADTWVYDIGESTWTQKSPAAPPSARAGHAMVHIDGDQVLLFGGDDGSYDDETWIYDLSANTWTQKSPATSPSARADFDMAYLGDDQVLLFGGNTGSDNDETWVYDLSANTWTQMFPATKPSPRSEHGMAHLGGNQALLFGGNDGILDDETWVYDLSANSWTQMSPASGPSARATLTMVYIGTDQALLFGGDAGGYNDETWIYDLSEDTWTEQVGTPHPSARYAFAMSESRMDGSTRIILFGGYHGTMSDQTWIFGSENQPEPQPPQAVQDLRVMRAFSTSVPGSKDIRLIWSAVTADTTGAPMTVDGYVVYRDILPDFVPGPATELGATANTTYLDAGAAGNTGSQYFYFVNARKATLESLPSQCVGEFDADLMNGSSLK